MNEKSQSNDTNPKSKIQKKTKYQTKQNKYIESTKRYYISPKSHKK